MALKDLLYTDVKPKGILLSGEGHPKCGKTEFAFTMPDPIFVLNLNFGLAGVIEKWVAQGKKIYVKNVQVPMTKDLPGQNFTLLSGAATEKWKDAILTLQEAVKDESVPSIFIDMGTELWDLLRIARLGKLTQVLPVQYAAVNAEFRQLLQILLNSGKNVYISHKIKPEYVNDQKTNRFERAGFGDIGYDVQGELLMSRDPKKEGAEQFVITFGDCRPNMSLKGQTLAGPDCNFWNVVSRIYPDTKPEDWGFR